MKIRKMVSGKGKAIKDLLIIETDEAEYLVKDTMVIAKATWEGDISLDPRWEKFVTLQILAGFLEWPTERVTENIKSGEFGFTNLNKEC